MGACHWLETAHNGQSSYQNYLKKVEWLIDDQKAFWATKTEKKGIIFEAPILPNERQYLIH